MAQKKQTAKSNLENTGERMIPEFHKGNLVYAEHITRYLSAEPIVNGKVVLDIASGSGYGTHILAETAKKVYGVDVDADAVAYAKSNFAGNNIEYKVGSGTKIPLEDNSVDVVVTFETIEHIDEYETFMEEISRVLKPEGVAIISTPNDIEFPEGAHYHVHEFEYDELFKLVKKQFKYIDPYFQATWRYVAVGDEKFFKDEWDTPLRTLNLAPLDDKKYLYFYLVCGNQKITAKLKPIAATGQHHSDREVIGSWADVQHELDIRQNHIDELYDLIKRTNEQNARLDAARISAEAKLDAIVSSKSHKLVTKLSNLKKKSS